MSNKTYDFLKYIAQIILPALGSLYYGLTPYWGLPASEAVVGSIMLVDVFLGTALGLSTVEYNAKKAKKTKK